MKIWILISILGIVIELFSTQLIAIWFTLASVISAIMCHYQIAIKWQWIQFIVTGVVLAIIFHPLAEKILKTVNYKPLNTPETILGKTGRIFKDNSGQLRAKIADNNWKIVSDDELEEGDIVKVVELKGVTLTVKKIKE